MTLDPKAPPDARLAYLQQQVQILNQDGAPILVGPFHSELGFEAIYWTPFIGWLKSKVKDFETRAHILTRGGAGCLYLHLAKQGLDLYAIRSVTDVRRAGIKQQKQQGIQKQISITAFDQAVIQDAAKSFGVRLPYHVVHPSLMYWAFECYWNELAGLKYLHSVCDFSTLPTPNPNGVLHLPEKFVAVKFYARHTFPYPHPDIAEFVKTTVATLAAQVPVVVLESSDTYDDHTDIPLAGPNIVSIGKDVPAHENVWLQAAIIGRATGFVGTYGGTAQLALRLGRPSVSFYQQWSGIGHAHFALNSWLSKSQGIPFLTGSLNDVSLWSQCTGLPGVPEVLKVGEAVTA